MPDDGEKQRLEIGKLRAEIAELEARTKAATGVWPFLRASAPYLTIGATVLLGLLGYSHELQSYLDQRERQQRLERIDLAFRTQERVVQIVTRLNDEQITPQLQTDLLLLLGGLGEPALPHLIRYLSEDYTEDVLRAVASGISKINREHAPSADNIELMMTGYRKAESIDKELKNSQSRRRLALAGDILKAVLSDPAVPMEQREAIKSRIPILVVSQSSQ